MPESAPEVTPRREGLGALDAVLLAGLLASLAAFLRTTVDFSRHPEEDAAMLLRYSQHLGEGHGIVWNVGEAPVDGATDFLFMVLVALLYRAGLGLTTAAQVVGVVAHALTVAALFLAARSVFGASRHLALLSAAFLAFGVGPRYLAAGYGTPLFALFACLTWWVACRLVQGQGDASRQAPLLAVCGLALGLARPEGVFLTAFILLAVLVARARRDAAPILVRFGVPFLVLGLAYFLWRWHYFGYPLPNPFYKKGGGVLHWPDLGRAFRDLYRLSGPFVWILVSGLLFARSRRQSAIAAIPVLGFTLLWVLVSDETNYFMRFRYPVLAIVLVSWIPVWHAVRDGLRLPPRRLVSAALVLLLAVAVARQPGRYRRLEPRRIGLHDAALVLREYEGQGYTLATTEAGLLPLYSEWKTVDAWGLNDSFVAHHGGITGTYLDARRPELIVVHAYSSPGVSEPEGQARRRGLPGWSEMVGTLEDYAHTRGYSLAAAFVKNAYDSHLYYVRPDLPDASSIAQRLQALDYYWDGAKLRNALAEPPD